MRAKVEISTLIAVQTDHDSGDGHRLFSHVTTRLREHKLVASPANSKGSAPLKSPQLIITLLVKNIPECPDKLLYVKGLELRELAVREREPKIYTAATSFGGLDLIPAVIDAKEASIERFEKDLNWMIDTFARAYWDWNSVK